VLLIVPLGAGVNLLANRADVLSVTVGVGVVAFIVLLGNSVDEGKITSRKSDNKLFPRIFVWRGMAVQFLLLCVYRLFSFVSTEVTLAADIPVSPSLGILVSADLFDIVLLLNFRFGGGVGEAICFDMPAVFTGAVRGELVKRYCLDLKVVSEFIGKSLESVFSASLIVSFAESMSLFGEIFVDNTEIISELFTFLCRFHMSGEG